MGACQSTPAVVNSERKHGFVHREAPTIRSDASPASHDGGSYQESNHSPEHKKKVFKNKKLGYSSGGSSCHGDMDSRHNKICEWKQELSADGNLTQAVVHIETNVGRNIEDVYFGVHDGPILGRGVAGVVRKVQHRDTGVYFAVKCLKLSLIESAKVLDALREEIFVMCQLDHPNILRLEEVYESDTQIFLIQQLCSGGDLFDRLEEQPDYHYSEVVCARLVKQMMSAVRYLHSKQIIHRDLKLENFLFTSRDSDELKCIDFGLSKHFKNDEHVHFEAVGTPYTIAPEVIKGAYDEKVDVWSMGVITYLLLSGDSPFGGCDGEPLMTVRNNILQGKLAFEPACIWDQVSESGKAFVKRLLTNDPAKRPTAREAQQDEWLRVYAHKDAPESEPLSPQLISNLREFKGYSDLHRMLLEVLSFTLRPEQIHSLKAEFEKIDPQGEGEISLQEMKEVLSNNAEAGSLGSLTETEVEEIFNSLKVQKSATTIRWHEFIAAGLSKYDFDDRNLKLAFDRLDSDRKGYIAYSDLSGMLCTSDGKMDDEIKKMWSDGLNEIQSKGKDKMSFEEFKSFLKGQETMKHIPTILCESP